MYEVNDDYIDFDDISNLSPVDSFVYKKYALTEILSCVWRRNIKFRLIKTLTTYMCYDNNHTICSITKERSRSC